MKCSLLGIVFFVDSFFFFQYFEYVILLFSGVKNFCGESTDSLLGVPFFVTSVFFLAAFKILALFLTFYSLIIIYLWCIWVQMDPDVHFSPQIKTFFSHYCFKYIFCPFLFLELLLCKYCLFLLCPVSYIGFLHSFIYIFVLFSPLDNF